MVNETSTAGAPIVFVNVTVEVSKDPGRVKGLRACVRFCCCGQSQTKWGYVVSCSHNIRLDKLVGKAFDGNVPKPRSSLLHRTFLARPTLSVTTVA